MKHIIGYVLTTFLVPLVLLSGCSGTGNIVPDTPEPARENLAPGNTTVIYEANERLFSKSGAIKDITANLDRIQSMGVNVIWLMPVCTQGSLKAFGSPYCIRNYKEVNPDYGTMDDLRKLVDTAHSKGMKVILDWIANHTSWDNAWITEHPEWYTQEGGQIISPKGMGWNDVADLNFNNRELRAAMTDAMLYWITEAGVDGFRCDYTDGVPADYWKDCFAALKERKKDLLLLGESSNAKYYDSGFDLLYAWEYASKLPKLYTGNLGVESLFATVQSEGDARIRYTFNHDTASSSSPASLYRSVEGELSAFVLTAFIGGVPMIYSSQEIGYSQTVNFMNWVTVDWKSNSPMQEKYRKVMSAYVLSADVRCGAPTVTSRGSVAEIRYKGNDGEGLYVLVNTSSKEQQVKITMELAGCDATDLISNTHTSLPTVQVLPAYGYVIYKTS